MAVKNPTAYIPQSGAGYVLTIGLLNLQDNLGHLIQTNSGGLLVTNPSQVVPKYPTAWTGSGA